MYLLDTNIIIDYLKHTSSNKHFLDIHDNIFTSYVVAGELLQGVRDKKDLRRTQNLLTTIDVDYGSISINRLALRLLEQYYLPHGIGFLDALIASTAIENQATLVTLNLKHFKPIKNLKVISSK